MIILKAIRAILQAHAGVIAKRAGGVHINAAPEGDAMPNVVLQLVSDLEAFTHAGPTGLIEDRVRIWARARSASEAGDLAAAINAALQNHAGEACGCAIQLCARAMQASDYQDGAQVHRCILDFNVVWRLV